MSMMDRAIELFDAYNKEDPRSIEWNGISYPAEYFYALQLFEWVRKLAPEASEFLLLAARAQHIGRWKSLRTSYPPGKAGYLSWRADLKQFHAKTTAALMKESGYDQEQINTVQRIILKEKIKSDEEVQVMEDALCLVFLQFQYADFTREHDENKIVRILRKSWQKMSDRGRQEALKLHFDEKGKLYLEKALA